MILNAYAVLDGFVSLLRLLVGFLVVGLGCVAWRTWRTSLAAESRKQQDDRYYLLVMLALLLLGLNVVSWPLFYLLLQSYVPEWHGVMCIYGVTQIGAGSVGISRFLPGVVKALEWTKPLLVFLTGGWFALYWVNRRTATSPLTRRVLAVLVLTGALSCAEAAADLAYLGIPKKEEYLSVGCCTVVSDFNSNDPRYQPKASLSQNSRSSITSVYYGFNLAMVVALALCGSSSVTNLSLWLIALLGGAVVNLFLSKVFLAEIAAPMLLHQPHHHCPYDLLPQVPESVIALVLFLVGTFSVGWACVIGWCARSEETASFLQHNVRGILRIGFACYLGSVLWVSLELAMA